MPKQGLFSSYYLAPIAYYFYLNRHSDIIEDVHENFVKQTYRNRFYIMSPNGIQCLTIPLIKVKRKKPFKDIRIAYDENWQKIHWKSIESAYRSSPYFEFYEDEFYPLFHEKFEYLIDLNTALNSKIIELLNMTVKFERSSKYCLANEDQIDYRTCLSPKNDKTNLIYPSYLQVFNDRLPFYDNLSILDLLFNEGPNSLNYIKSIHQKNED